MASKIKVKLILELRDAHMSRNSIASTRNMSRSSVSEVFHIADELQICYNDIRRIYRKMKSTECSILTNKTGFEGIQ